MNTGVRSQIEARVRTSGLKLTPQRFAVLDYLIRSHMHPTAEQISANLNRRFPRASRATIYNTLNALRDAHLVHEIYVDDSVARYDANIEPHHHFVCRMCSSLIDVPLAHIGKLSHCDIGPGCSVENYEIVFRGVCQTCAAACAAAHTSR